MPIQSTSQSQPTQTQGQIALPIDNSLSFTQNQPDEAPQAPAEEADFYENLAEKLEEKLLVKIGKTVIEGFDKDLQSRSEWDENIKKGIKNLGIRIEELNDPFEGACSATHPLILESAVKFQSKATAELLPASGPVRTKVMGMQTDEKINAARRVKDFLNYQIMDVMTEYVPDMERLLLMLPLMGSAFKKTYWNTALDRPESCFISSDNFVINNGARSIEKARRHTEVLPPITGAELRQKIINGDYIEPRDWVSARGSNAKMIAEDITGNTAVGGTGSFYITDVSRAIATESGFQNVALGTMDDEKIFTLLEQHCFLNLPTSVGGEPGYTLPFVVTVEKDSGKVLAIRRNWRDGDPNKKKRVWYSHYPYIPGMGFYGLGLFHLLGNFNATLTAIIRSLVDSGQFATMQGGFKAKGMRIIGDNGTIAPGEWKDVEGSIQKLSEAFLPLPYKEPSATLFEMLKYLEVRGQSFADSTEQVLADSTNYGPVGTTVALIEASMKLFNAIHKRLHFAQKNDLKILAEINYEYLPDNYPYDVPGGQQNVFKIDFDPKNVLVIPVSDPNITSQAHRISLAQTKLQAALQKPEIHNMKSAFKDFYLAIGADNIDNLLPPDEQAQPLDPLSDIMAMVQGKPIQAFPGQNHQAHVQFKITWIQDPIVGGGSEPMKPFIPQIQANIRQHQVLQFQEQVQGMTQQQMAGAPDPKTVAAIQADAAKQVLQANQALQAVTMGQDPMHMLAQAEMIKAQAEKQKVDNDKTESTAKLALDAQSQEVDLITAQAAAARAGIEVQQKQFDQGLKVVQQSIDNAIRMKEVAIQEKIANKPAPKPSGK